MFQLSRAKGYGDHFAPLHQTTVTIEFHVVSLHKACEGSWSGLGAPMARQCSLQALTNDTVQYEVWTWIRKGSWAQRSAIVKARGMGSRCGDICTYDRILPAHMKLDLVVVGVIAILCTVMYLHVTHVKHGYRHRAPIIHPLAFRRLPPASCVAP